MSDQRAFGVCSLSGREQPDSSFDVATRALDKMRAEQAAADAAAFDMEARARAKGDAAKPKGGSGAHERQASGVSLRTDESSFTADTRVTGVTATSREGEWELERYLRGVEA